MIFKDFATGENDSGRRLDRVILRIPELKTESKTQIFMLLRKKLIRVNMQKSIPEYKIKENDVINIADFLINQNCCNKNTDSFSNFDDLNIKTIFKNEHIWIINKPRGINVQPANTQEKALSSYILSEWNKTNNDSSLSFTPGPMHRLDKNTTGLIAFSQSLQGATWFSKIMENHQLKKIYVGIAQGKLTEPQLWTDNLIDSNQNQTYKTVSIDKSGSPDSKSAVTKATPLAYGIHNDTPLTLVQFEILTGRKHQIRCQSAAHNIPLFGDSAYNKKSLKNQVFFLHAAKILLPQNSLEIPQQLTCPLPKDFLDFLELNLINWDGEFIIN